MWEFEHSNEKEHRNIKDPILSGTSSIFIISEGANEEEKSATEGSSEQEKSSSKLYTVSEIIRLLSTKKTEKKVDAKFMNDITKESVLANDSPCASNTTGAYIIMILIPVSCWMAAIAIPTNNAFL